MPDDDPRDEALQELLGRALADGDPVPAAIHDAALSAFEFCDLDTALAELVADLAVTRTDGSDLLVFATDDVEIAVEAADTRCRGQISPPGGWEARLESPGRPGQPLDVDDLGRFEGAAPTGPMRVVLRGGGRSVRTAWFQV